MDRKPERLGLILLLALSLTNISGIEAFASNTLNQVDVRKSSSDGLDFTLYTSSPYADNVVVSKKSDNKYVILMPNVNSANGVKPDLSSVKDVVTNVDVHAVNDGQSGYTKVTITTNRPVNIKTNTAKSTPVTQEQREYRALIAQQKSQPKAAQPQQTAKTTTAAKPAQTTQPQTSKSVKLPEIQPTKTAADIAAANKASASVKKDAPKTTTKPVTQTVKKDAEKPAVAKKVDTKADKKVQEVKEVATKKIEQPKTKTEQKPATAKASDKLASTETKPVTAEKPKVVPPLETVQQTEPAVHEVQKVQEQTTSTEEVKNNASSTTFSTLSAKIKNKLGDRLPSSMPITVAIILTPLVCIFALFNIIKSSLRNSRMLKDNFLNNIALSKQPKAPKNYDNIINDENLTWQEKYHQYRNASGENSEQKETENQYKFVADSNQKVKVIEQTPPVKQIKAFENSEVKAPEEPVQEIVQQEVQKEIQKEIKQEVKKEPKKQIQKVEKVKNSIINIGPVAIKKVKPEPKAATSKWMRDFAETSRQKLERIMQASPSVEKTQIANDVEKIEEAPAVQNPVAEENDKIHNEINKTIKLKAFAEKTTLSETHRNKRIKHRRVQIELPKEVPHVELGYSQLHTNPRSFKDANLSVSDLIAKNDRLLNIQPEQKDNNYDMITVDEYFNIMSDNKSKVTSSLSDVVANSLGKIKQPKAPDKPLRKVATNPIEALRNETREDYLNGLIIKSGYNIDTERGFYLVSLDGKSAVIGRIKDEVFVLKKFDRNITKPLQVRMDNPNVYMVKAEGFKSLVEVNNDKMGVLIEL